MRSATWSATVFAMHELAIMEDMVETVAERIGSERVRCVRLEIGDLAGVACDALRFCFEICVAGTALEQSVLEIVRIPARATCLACNREHPIAHLGAPCACGSYDQRLLAGTELRLKEVELL